MSAKSGSRWANTKEDEELEAKIRKDKEEKRRRKADKARKLDQAKQAAALAVPQQQTSGQDEDDGRGSKRRKLTPEPSLDTKTNDAPPKLLRFETGTWGKCRSVENYDKLNDIEEGTYGWVARAAELATGKVVALKRLKLDLGDRSGLPVTGLREIQILKDCKHRNIVAMEEVVVGDDITRLDK